MDLGANNKLGFIKTYDNLSEIPNLNDGLIIIDNSQEIDPKLKYLKEDNGNKVWITIDGSDSPINAANMSDLEYQLRKRDWNITERIFTNKLYKVDITTKSPENLSVISSTTPYPSTTTSTPVPEIPSDSSDEDLYLFIGKRDLSPIPDLKDYGIENNKDGYIKISDTYEEQYAKEFEQLYEDLIIKKDMKLLFISNNGNSEETSELVELGSHYYYNIVSARDLNKGTSFIDLISMSDSSYTSTVNLNGVLKMTPEIDSHDCLLVVGIQYTKSEKIYSEELSFFLPKNRFIAESITNSDIFLGTDFISEKTDSFTVEYHDGCIRVFPESNKITECIISYCYLSYDGLY